MVAAAGTPNSTVVREVRRVRCSHGSDYNRVNHLQYQLVTTIFKLKKKVEQFRLPSLIIRPG